MLLQLLEDVKASLTLPWGWSFGTGVNQVNADIYAAQAAVGGEVNVIVNLIYKSDKSDDYTLSVIRQSVPYEDYTVSKGSGANTFVVTVTITHEVAG